MPEIDPSARPTIIGSTGNDTLSATATIREDIVGLAGDDTFNFYEGDTSDHFFGGMGNDTLEGLVLIFSSPNSYAEFAELSFDGGRGYDTVNMDIYLAQSHTDLVLGDIATLNSRIDEHAYEIDILSSYLETSSVRIIGGDINETIQITDSTAGGSASINARMGGGRDYLEIYGDDVNWLSIRVHTGSGRDTVLMAASADGARILTGNGADTVQLDAIHNETVMTGRGDDQVYVLAANHADDHDTISTGRGDDRIYFELDNHSLMAEITDFAFRRDTLVFNSDDIDASELYFNQADAEASTAEDVLFMDNSSGRLFYNGGLMVEFDGATSLSVGNFLFEDYLA